MQTWKLPQVYPWQLPVRNYKGLICTPKNIYRASCVSGEDQLFNSPTLNFALVWPSSLSSGKNMNHLSFWATAGRFKINWLLSISALTESYSTSAALIIASLCRPLPQSNAVTGTLPLLNASIRLSFYSYLYLSCCSQTACSSWEEECIDHVILLFDSFWY